MSRNVRQPGFSLMETLLAVGTLAVGMLFIGGTFMTGIYFTGLSTERTIASVAADEAFAKIRLFGDPNMAGLSTATFLPYDGRVRQRDKGGRTVTLIDEYLYPSTGETTSGQYSWAAICKRVNTSSRQVQFTVFICREGSAESKYWVRKTGAAAPGFTLSDLPRPVRVATTPDPSSTDELIFADPVKTDGIDECAFISDGTSIVDDATGQIYRVLKRIVDQPDQPQRIKLDRPWTSASGDVWVVPPPTVGGRDPLAAIYQKAIRFPVP
jgi:Tfp pilus assembly protein PilV